MGHRSVVELAGHVIGALATIAVALTHVPANAEDQTPPSSTECADALVLSRRTLALPAEFAITVATERTLLVVVIEHGVDVVLTAGTGAARRFADLPPTAYATAVLSVPPGAAQRTLAISAAQPSAGEATLDVAFFCPTNNALDSSADHYLALARVSERLGAWLHPSAPAVAAPALAQAAATAVDAELERPATGSGFPPRLHAQLLHARGFIEGRNGEPAAAHQTYLAAAAAWRHAELGFVAAIATHRAAQQARRAGRADEAAALLLTLSAMPEIVARDAQLGVVLNDLCLALRDLDRIDETVPCFEKAIAAHRRAGSAGDQALSLANLSDVLARLGRFSDADDSAAEAVRTVPADARPNVRALVALTASTRALERGDLARAGREAQRALEIAERASDRALAAYASTTLATVYRLIGIDDRARRHAERALAIFRSGGFGPRRIATALLAADIARREGRHSDALMLIDEAAAVADSEAIAPTRRLTIELVKAKGLLAAARLDDAKAAIDALASRATTDASSAARIERVAIAIDVARGVDQERELGRWLARLAPSSPSLDRADLLTLAARDHDNHGRLDDARAAWKAAFDESLRVARLIDYPLHRRTYLANAEQSLARWTALSYAADRSATGAAARIGAFAAWRDAAALTASDAATSEASAAFGRTLVARLLDGSDTAAGSDDAEALRLAELLTRIEFERGARVDAPRADAGIPSNAVADVAQLGIFVGDDAIYAWRVDGDAVREVRIDDTDGAMAAVAALVERLAERAPGDGTFASALSAMTATFDLSLLRAPAAARWRVVVDGRLARVPPLLWIAPERLLGAAHRNEPFPAIVIAQRWTPRAQESSPCCAGNPLHAFADPAPAASSAASAIARLPRLPASRREIELIAATRDPHPVELYLGAEFNSGRVLAALASGGAIVHIATHGLINTSDAAFSTLLTSGIDPNATEAPLSLAALDGAEINAVLVVLSACEAAIGASFDAAGVVGVTDTLIARGAERVIAPLYPIDDRGSLAQQRAIYTALAEGLAPEAALAKMQTALTEKSVDAAAWLALVAIGE